VGGHEIRPNHMKVKATRFRQDAECNVSNPATSGRQSGLRPPRRESPSKPRGTAAIRGYCLVSVSRIGAIEAPFPPLVSEATFWCLVFAWTQRPELRGKGYAFLRRGRRRTPSGSRITG
jgi:hypothetical protein